jgi:hypothetical protein
MIIVAGVAGVTQAIGANAERIVNALERRSPVPTSDRIVLEEKLPFNEAAAKAMHKAMNPDR